MNHKSVQILKKTETFKPAIRFLGTCLISICVMLFAACTNPAESNLLGCFAFKENGKADLKITEKDGRNFLSVRKGKGWSEPEELHSGSSEEIQPLFGDASVRVKANLVANKGPFGIFLVTPGEVYGGKKAVTEYLAFVIFGGGSVYKVPCE